MKIWLTSRAFSVPTGDTAAIRRITAIITIRISLVGKPIKNQNFISPHKNRDLEIGWQVKLFKFSTSEKKY
jgi:hypothetical protein